MQRTRAVGTTFLQSRRFVAYTFKDSSQTVADSFHTAPDATKPDSFVASES